MFFMKLVLLLKLIGVFKISTAKEAGLSHVSLLRSPNGVQCVTMLVTLHMANQ